MRDLSRFFENPFDDHNLSTDEVLRFTSDHLQRMIANNPGAILNLRINATTTALTGFTQSLTSDEAKRGARKARKQTKDAFRTSLPTQMAKIYAAVVAKFGPGSPELSECFPQGRSVFASCSDDALESHLRVVIQGITTHQSDVGASVLNDASGLLSTWLVVYAASESATGAKVSAQHGKNDARKALQLELFKNLLTLALNFPRQPEMAAVFIQQSLLENRSSAPDIAQAVITLGTYDEENHAAHLTLTAAGAKSFVLRRKLSTEPEWMEVASNIEATNGATEYVDVVPGPGHYDYVAVGQAQGYEGLESNPVGVDAT